MAYIDGFMAAVPTANKQKYLRHAKKMSSLFKEHGAQQLVECWGDDIPPGKLTSFPMAVKCKKNETVVFSWILWPSRAVRNKAWKKMMADPRMQPGSSPMPFDGKRMIFGGFNVVLES
ncbi:MAG: DUF1428 domain-containing protein [Proteobacteria bacterium]|jgi:uncharacterized protein YbaA (DUF1428 family)|nr:DUF1428 domain-containing protein [Pseudomonadota bacterium]